MGTISIDLVGKKINIDLLFDKTKEYFEANKAVLTEYKSSYLTLRLSDDLWERHRKESPDYYSDAYTEYCALIGLTSRELLKEGYCIFHGMAFMWKGKAWLFTAPSGTGKTTQYLLWNTLFGDEITLINGDKPLIQTCKSGKVYVHPSPWNGKEELFGCESAELAGIIYLSQSKENTICRMTSRDAILPIYSQFLYYGEFEDEIRAVGVMEDRILRNIPIWKLENLGDEDSVMLTRKTMEEYLNEKNNI